MNHTLSGPFTVDTKTWRIRDAKGIALGLFSYHRSAVSARVPDDERALALEVIVAALDATFPPRQKA